MSESDLIDTVLDGQADLLVDLESTYRDLHAHPELSSQERRTAGVAAGWLQRAGYDVTTGVGGTGVVGTPCAPVRAACLGASFTPVHKGRLSVRG